MMDAVKQSSGYSEVIHVEENHNAVLDNLDRMNKELQTLQDQFLSLGVRTHLLEVELATQFSPDLLEAIDNTQLACYDCENAIEEHSSSDKTIIDMKSPSKDRRREASSKKDDEIGPITEGESLVNKDLTEALSEAKKTLEFTPESEQEGLSDKTINGTKQ